jgi:hypothetical protein
VAFVKSKRPTKANYITDDQIELFGDQIKLTDRQLELICDGLDLFVDEIKHQEGSVAWQRANRCRD